MNANDDVRDRLRLVAEATPLGARAGIEEQLRVEFRNRHRAGRTRLRVAGLVAASLMLASGLYVARQREAQAPSKTGGADGVELPGFIALPYAASGVPLEEPVIVRTTIALSDFSAIGLRPAPEGAGKARVAADVLIGQDGVPRAVRIVE